ncbi:mucoidy inhibitor A [Coprinopsis marcescibilis]|uniref:Mucoidy inhibitor A n=1 Tax=Coprinopsis marcescibilis TaxID=230819 RepID=A0A5C3KVN2_COPMA|nr:mucoidy inhibitor A [Coprinopsis marcescibilis]
MPRTGSPAASADSIPPPPFNGSHTIELVAGQHSKITGVSVYSSYAHVTRLFKFKVRTGRNQVVINGLPHSLKKDSFRVEGRGSASIHDVTIARVDPPARLSVTSPRLDQLRAEDNKLARGLRRAEKELKFLDSYFTTLDVQKINVSELQEIIDGYDTAKEKLEEKVVGLEAKRGAVREKVRQEEGTQEGDKSNSQRTIRATIGIFASGEGSVELIATYAVRDATWAPTYDIRVNTESKLKHASITYKGSITQNSGEDWTDTSITLETATLTVGAFIPTLSAWKVSVYDPSRSSRHRRRSPTPLYVHQRRSLSRSRSPECRRQASSRSRSRSRRRDERRSRSYSPMGRRTLDVSGASHNITFTVPGLMTIPSDNIAHGVTIADLSLGAKLEWVAIPKLDSRVHLKAIIKNASEYLLLNGIAHVYVDGSFVSKYKLPLVSPEEGFDCHLGIDRSIRIAYAPLSKKLSQSGFVNKSQTHSYTQSISIQNTKSVAVESLKILDHVPVSEDATVAVKLISPALTLPDINSSSSSSGLLSPKRTVENRLGVRVPTPVTVSQGIVAQWQGSDDIASEGGVERLGKDGQIVWSCVIPSQGKVNLKLQFEISAPVGANISGLAR